MGESGDGMYFSKEVRAAPCVQLRGGQHARRAAWGAARTTKHLPPPPPMQPQLNRWVERGKEAEAAAEAAPPPPPKLAALPAASAPR